MTDLFLKVINTSLLGSFVIIVLSLFKKLIKKQYSVQWEYIIWFVLTVRMLIFVSLPLPSLTIPVQAPIIETTIDQTNAEKSLNKIPQDKEKIDKKFPPIQINKQQDKKVSTFSFSAFILPAFTAIWILGTFLFLFFHTFSYLIFLKKVKLWHIPASDNIINKLTLVQKKIKSNSQFIFGFVILSLPL